MAKATSCVRDKILIYNDGEQMRTILVGYEDWWRWLTAPGTSTFRFELGEAPASLVGKMSNFTAKREQKGATCYWYAYRKLRGRLRKTYLGRAEELTWERMEQAAQALAHEGREQAELGDDGRVPEELVAQAHGGGNLPLLTKLYVPQAARKELVERSRLYERLNKGVRRKLVLISAPAGFGKRLWLSWSV